MISDAPLAADTAAEQRGGGPPESSHRWQDDGNSVTVFDVELFAEYDGAETITRDDLERIAEVTNRMMIRGRHPTIVIGHERHNADQGERPAVGYVRGPLRVGLASSGRYTIFGDMVFDASRFYGVIRAGDFPRRSIERVTKADDATPVDWIAQVALLGKSVPAHDLPDVRFYSREEQQAYDADETERPEPMTIDDLIGILSDLSDEQRSTLRDALSMLTETEDNESDDETEDNGSKVETEDNSIDARIVALTAQVGQLEAERERATVEQQIAAIRTEGYSLDVGDEVEIALAIDPAKREAHYARIRQHYKRDARAELAHASNEAATIASAAQAVATPAMSQDVAAKVYHRGEQILAESPNLTERQAYAKAATELGINLTR